MQTYAGFLLFGEARAEIVSKTSSVPPPIVSSLSRWDSSRAIVVDIL